MFISPSTKSINNVFPTSHLFQVQAFSKSNFIKNCPVISFILSLMPTGNLAHLKEKRQIIPLYLGLFIILRWLLSVGRPIINCFVKTQHQWTAIFTCSMQDPIVNVLINVRYKNQLLTVFTALLYIRYFNFSALGGSGNPGVVDGLKVSSG